MEELRVLPFGETTNDVNGIAKDIRKAMDGDVMPGGDRVSTRTITVAGASR